MSKAKLWRSIGLMSGTSADGIDAAVIETDGESEVRPGAVLSLAYEPALRARILSAYGHWERSAEIAALEADLTRRHGAIVARLLDTAGIDAGAVDVIGFHGQTLSHDAARGRTWQIGDGPLLASLIGIDVVFDLRAADVAAGGQGAPLAPAYHRALAAGLPRPLVVVNIGGIANVTYLPEAGDPLAFDTGPGNGPIDDWVGDCSGMPFDRDGRLAAAGTVNERRLAAWLAHPYFERTPPKSLDRKDFDGLDLAGLSLEDGAATLTAFTARTIARAAALLPAPPETWLVTGGGRRNPVLMAALRSEVPGDAVPVEQVGWDGDALEAQAFAYLAVRSRLGLALTWPGTTGVAAPISGGRFAPAGQGASSEIRPGRDQAISASRSSR